MRTTRAKLTQLLGLFAVLTLIVAGCGGAGGRGGASGDVSLSGAEFTVGSKEFTEQLILGQITLQVLENAGATVNDQIGLAGTVAARKALESGEIDMYWEYTGTAGSPTSATRSPSRIVRSNSKPRPRRTSRRTTSSGYLRPLRPTTPTPWPCAARPTTSSASRSFLTSSSWSRRTRKRHRVCGDRVLDPRRRPAGDGESIRFRVPEGEHRQDRRRSDLPTDRQGRTVQLR